MTQAKQVIDEDQEESWTKNRALRNTCIDSCWFGLDTIHTDSLTTTRKIIFQPVQEEATNAIGLQLAQESIMPDLVKSLDLMCSQFLDRIEPSVWPMYTEGQWVHEIRFTAFLMKHVACFSAVLQAL